MLLNFRWSVPAWLLLAAYFMFGFPPLWVFFIALAFWPLAAVSMTLLMRLLRRLAYTGGGYTARSGGKVVHVDDNTPSANPYSVTREKEQKLKDEYSGLYDPFCCPENDSRTEEAPPAGTELYPNEASDEEDTSGWVTVYQAADGTEGAKALQAMEAPENITTATKY